MNSIDDLDFSKTYTYADYVTWEFEERLELIKGKIFEMGPTPNANHQLILGNIAGELHQFLKYKSCRVFMAPFDVCLIRDEITDQQITTVVQPDICVISDLAKLKDQRGCFGTPDLMIEILSLGNNVKEVKIKYELYEEFGVREYWLVFPSGQSIVRYVLNESCRFEMEGRALANGDTITTPILPGFELALDDVFNNLI